MPENNARYQVDKTYRYIHTKKTYRLEHITPQSNALPDVDRVLYLSKQGEPMMAVPLAIATRFLEPYTPPTPLLPEDEGMRAEEEDADE